MGTSTTLPPGWEKSRLARELETFLTHRPEWLVTARDKYVLIKDEEVIGFYEWQEEALAEGYRRFRRDPFMVQRIQEDFDTYYFGGSSFLAGQSYYGMEVASPLRTSGGRFSVVAERLSL